MQATSFLHIPGPSPQVSAPTLASENQAVLGSQQGFRRVGRQNSHPGWPGAPGTQGWSRVPGADPQGRGWRDAGVAALSLIYPRHHA